MRFDLNVFAALSTRMGSKSKFRAFLTLSLILVLLSSGVGTIMLLVPSAHAASTPGVYYVSPPPSGSDSTGNGSITRPYATISHAVLNATWYYSKKGIEPTVLVGPGTYNEAVVFSIPLKLMSESSQPANTIVNASGLANGIAAVNATSAGSVIEGFTVENANNHGIFVQDSSNVRVENNFVSNNGLSIQKGLGEDKALQLTGTSNSIVASNTVVGNLYGGIGIADDGAVDPSWNATGTQGPGSGIPAGSANPGNNNLISGNSVTNNRPNHCAIVVSAYDPNEGVSNNILVGNVVVDNQNGVIIAADLPNTIAINNTVIGNQILGNGEGGVIVHSNAAGDTVTGNSILNNVFDSNGYQPTLEGVVVGGEDPSVPAHNTLIMGNTFEEEAIGIAVVNGVNTTVGGNIFEATVPKPINVTSGTVTTITTPTTTVSSSNSQAQTAMYLSYAAVAIAIVFGGVAIYLSTKRTPPTAPPPTAK
jgi:parallel beta-helix repeat protein